MKKKKGVVVFLVMIIAMLLLGYYSYGIVKGTAAKDNDKGVKLGLDLAGGVSITYQVKGDETPSAEDRAVHVRFAVFKNGAKLGPVIYFLDSEYRVKDFCRKQCATFGLFQWYF